MPSPGIPSPNILTRPVRTRNVSVKYKNYICVPSVATTQYSTSCTYPRQNYMNYQNISPKYYAYLATTLKISVPYSFKKAVKDPHWCAAMKDEINALEKNNTQELIPAPTDQHIIDCKWLVKVKYNSDRSVERYKARLVAREFTQEFGIDYFDTFSPVANMMTVRVLLSVVAVKNQSVRQLDVNNAFLHGDLNETIFIKLPPGDRVLSSAVPNSFFVQYVCKLKKFLYGLKQAPRCCYTKLLAALKQYGFCQSHSDNSLFTYKSDQGFRAILVYVDDILVIGSSNSQIATIKGYICTKFKIKDLGPLGNRDRQIVKGLLS